MSAMERLFSFLQIYCIAIRATCSISCRLVLVLTLAGDVLSQKLVSLRLSGADPRFCVCIHPGEVAAR